MRNARTKASTRAAAGAALLTAALVLTGCGASGTDAKSDGARDLSAARPADGSGAGAAESRTGGSAGADAAKAPEKAAAQQHVIRTASLSVEVGDVTKALAAARTATAGAGGHVENEATQRGGEGYVTSRVVLRVPQERYDAVLGELAGTGKLLARTADAKDVTGEVVDVTSRIATQRASVARVRALMDRAERLSDVVTLEGELSRRQADLEALLAQQASLKDRTSLATITLELTEKRKEPQAAAPEDDRPGFLDALGGGWDALVGAVSWVVIVLAALAPWLAVAVIAFVLWRRVIRPRLPRRAAVPPAPLPVQRPGRPAPERNAAGAVTSPGTGE
ncbi:MULTISPECIES: DUF4349 domain-containing protein [unclassified Streptomyces]|uniref:DUF4349 domain-containing protein n=1 Tax=unclassified Streptomyces TaxID=2593676 RepID=UPI0006F3AF0A|nr:MULTISPECIES: DUF4349 domain-containing protein [unclassified Streptomyces]KQX55822.1 hypothetical protein ASD33_31100 [Streptomyces sp. Root1304]KRA96419.1 hypothetical protein ASE09_27865 [Streptomyces sp. Root66D1]